MQIIKKYHDYPELASVHALVHMEKDVVFLDSSQRNQLGKFSILGLTPYLKLEKIEGILHINGEPSEESFESYVKYYLKEHKEDQPEGLPMGSGAIGYFTYDYGREKDEVVSRHPKEVHIPDGLLIFYDNYLVEDHESGCLTLIANGNKQNPKDGIALMEQLLEQAKNPAPKVKEAPVPGTIFSNFGHEEYLHAVQRMINYIIEGDIYITNMTQQLRIRSEMDPYVLFDKLRVSNPSPFGGYFQYGDFQMVCASPERFLQMRDGLVQTRPIKGTRKRGETPEEDEALKLELQESSKDQSELLMIVDLERNDLNRVCVPGSVQVDELFTVETYATVFHLISNIRGQLDPNLDVMDLMNSAFPGGSITGAPKLRAMEIIDELENSRRNIYTGSIGYIALNGDCDFNIVIRTALKKDGMFYLGVGGGITCESDLEFEYEETIQKAKALLVAMDVFGQPIMEP